MPHRGRHAYRKPKRAWARRPGRSSLAALLAGAWVVGLLALLPVGAAQAADNTAPIAVDDVASTSRNVPVAVFPLENDTDADGDSLTLVDHTAAAHGDLDCQESGLCWYLPAADYFGDDGFTYTVSDGQGGTDVGSVAVTVAENGEPQATADSVSSFGDAPATIDVLANDSDPDGDPLTLIGHGQPPSGQGETSCTAAGVCTYTPHSFRGDTNFSYSVSDGHGHTQTAEVSVSADAAPAASIDSAGPLTRIGISEDLNCSANHELDVAGEWFGDTACGTFAVVDDEAFSPRDIPAGITSTPWTPVSQSAVLGAGTEANPYRIITTVAAGTSGVTLTQTDSYVVGQESYRTSIELHNDGPARSVRLYRAGDCYLGGDDTGIGATDPATGSVSCVNDETHRIEQFLPLSNGSHYFEALYSDVWSVIADKQPFPDTCRCDEKIDNGAGLQWDVSVAAGGSATRASLVTFSPDGSEPLVTTKTVDDDSVGPGDTVTYTIHVANPGATPAHLTEVVDDLPAGFSYLTGTSHGATTSDPASSGGELTWAADATIAAGAEATLTFSAVAAEDAGTFFNVASAQATDQVVVPTGPTAPVTVTGVPPTNQDPVATDDTLTVDQDSSGVVDVLANDSDPDGDALSVTGATTPAHGTVSCTPAGACTYSPDAGYAGPDSFDYTVADGHGHTDTGTVSVTVKPAPTTGDVDVALTKTTRRDSVAVGNNVVYWLTVSNLTMTKVRDLVVTDALPAGFVFRDTNKPSCGTAVDASTQGLVLTCTVEKLHPNSKVTIRVRGAFTIAGSATNSATVTVAGDVDESNNTDTIVSEARGESCTIVGTFGDDELHGTDAPDVICGLDGDDRFDTHGGGRDLVYGNNGDDTFSCDREDVFIGGPGRDHSGRNHREPGRRSASSW